MQIEFVHVKYLAQCLTHGKHHRCVISNCSCCYMLDSVQSVFKKQLYRSYNSHTVKFSLLKCTIQWFLINRVVQPSPPSNFRKFSFSLPKTPQQSLFFPQPMPSPLTTTTLLFVSMDLPILEFYINGIMRYVDFCVSFSIIQHNVFKVHPCFSMYQYFTPFLRIEVQLIYNII